jgi:hypothetical protein
MERKSLTRGLLSYPEFVKDSVDRLEVLPALSSASAATVHDVRRHILGMMNVSDELWMERLDILDRSVDKTWIWKWMLELFLLRWERYVRGVHCVG